jgi:ABC-type multidrug transport system ATPase subunit/uncharacterized tellurite resistance protein B-like protein
MTTSIFESIVKIFAIITKSDGVAQQELVGFDKFLSSQFDGAKFEHYKKFFNDFIDKIDGTADEMRIYASEVAAELEIEQRLLIYVRICEIVKSDGIRSNEEISLLKVLTNIFHLDVSFVNIVESFVFTDDDSLLEFENIGYIQEGYIFFNNNKIPIQFNTESKIAFSFIKEVGFFIIRILWTKEDLYFNNQILTKGNTFFLYPGSVIMTMNLDPVQGVFMGLVVFGEVENNGSQLHFSKLWSIVNYSLNKDKNLFICDKLEYCHPNGAKGLLEFNFKSQSGDLIALMGSSGSGKSTLLNILNGNLEPSSGRVLFNGVNIHKEEEYVKPYFGYVPQDDLLIEDLTVFENLYFSASLSVPNLTKSEVSKKVIELLKEVGLYEVKDIKVGNPLSKTISGGQRKRLNICLELIRNPQVLFMDEPTSGLSSRDSDNIMNLLRKLSFRGTLIFVVIHQPSSGIYKLFDQLILLDIGGYPIYTGDPVDAVSYFKRCISHISSNVTSCPACGNINPEIIFDIVEGEIIDDVGDRKDERKTSPSTWFTRFRLGATEVEKDEIIVEKPPLVKNKNIMKQFMVFLKRDFISKLSNKQYLLITLIEPFILSFLLSFVVRFYPFFSDNNLVYVFAENENLPSFIFISIIVSIFMGLSLSAEEIFKDLKILKREEFLSLSRFGYLGSKVGIQFFISFVQTIIFLLPSCFIIGNFSMFFEHFLILFTCACFGNILALNISSSLSTIGTIYILIPILLIPQLILGGIIVSFDKMNPSITNRDKVPVIGDFMASRWAFEAACVAQFRDNKYGKIFYPIDKEISKYAYKTIYWIPQVENRIDEIPFLIQKGDNISIFNANEKLKVIRNEISKENEVNGLKKFDTNLLSVDKINFKTLEELKNHLTFLETSYKDRLSISREKKDDLYTSISKLKGDQYLRDLQNNNHNKSLGKLVDKKDGVDRIVEINNELVQIVDPIYNDTYVQKYQMDCRSNFFSPVKYLFGKKINTYWFNLGVIWMMIVTLFGLLYYNVLKKILSISIRINN